MSRFQTPKSHSPVDAQGLRHDGLLVFDTPLDTTSDGSRETIRFGPLNIIQERIQMKGSAPHTEDVAVVSYPFFGVADATSEVYVGDPAKVKAEILPGTVTLGQLAALCFRDLIGNADRVADLDTLLREINRSVGHEYTQRDFDINKPETVGGVVGVIGKIDHDRNLLIIKQWGDSLFVVEKRDGTVGVGRNMVEAHDREMLAKVAELSQKYGPGSKELWGEFAPFLKEKRSQRINSDDAHSYPILNGQANFPERALDYSAPLNEVKRVLVFSDGLVRGDLEAMSMAELGRHLLELHSEGGLRLIYDKTREREAGQHGGHCKFVEITALAFTFP